MPSLFTGSSVPLDDQCFSIWKLVTPDLSRLHAVNPIIKGVLGHLSPSWAGSRFSRLPYPLIYLLLPFPPTSSCSYHFYYLFSPTSSQNDLSSERQPSRSFFCYISDNGSMVLLQTRLCCILRTRWSCIFILRISPLIHL